MHPDCGRYCPVMLMGSCLVYFFVWSGICNVLGWDKKTECCRSNNNSAHSPWRVLATISIILFAIRTFFIIIFSHFVCSPQMPPIKPYDVKYTLQRFSGIFLRTCSHYIYYSHGYHLGGREAAGLVFRKQNSFNFRSNFYNISFPYSQLLFNIKKL